MNEKKLDVFTNLDGRGIRVGIIDSGYTPSRTNVNLVGGVDLSHSNGKVKGNNEYVDLIGHGTACAGVLAKKAPQAEVYAVKIFGQELVSEVDQLCQAIKWCVDQKLHLINVSLGTTESENAVQIQEACDLAVRQGIMVVAAISNDGQKSYPAVLPNVFGVGAGKVRGKFGFFYDSNRPVQFVARGDKQRLDWVDGKQVFSAGSSYACPHISAILALLLQQFPGIELERLDKILENLSLDEEPDFVVDDGFKPIGKVVKQKSQRAISSFQPNIKNIERALLYPYNKEMHGLVRFRDTLPFEIAHVVDVVGKRMVGKDCGEAIGVKPSGLTIQSKLEACLNDVDTLILGHLDEICRIKRRDVMKDLLGLALEHNKNVFSLGPIDEEIYPEEVELFKAKGLQVGFPKITPQNTEEILTTYDGLKENRKPVLGIFGTGSQQGKFTIQLMLRKALQERGYKVGQLGTEHQSFLFGFDFTFPNGYSGSRNVHIPMDQHIALLQSVMVGIEEMEPDIIVVGGQSGIVPYSYVVKSHFYTIPSLLLLLGTVPDAYVLVIDSTDELEYIAETIRVIEGLGKGKVIFLAVTHRRKVYTDRFGKVFANYEMIGEGEMEGLVDKVENIFHLPTSEFMSEEGRDKMTREIEAFFSKA